MRDRMERFASFPFFVGCVSHSSVDVVQTQPKKPQAESNPAPTSIVQSNNNGRMRSSSLPLPKPNISAGIQKVIKRFKSLSYLFHFYKDEGDEEEIEMEIGLPTDVQHVAHIGWDGFNSGSTGMKSWDKGPELLSLPTISLRQFELAMAAQAGGPH